MAPKHPDMKKVLLTLCLLLPCLLAAQMRARRIVDDRPEAPYHPLILQISADSVASRLADMGVVIFASRGDLLLTSVPTDRLREILADDGILAVADDGDASRALDIARPMCNVDAVHQGLEGLPQAFDGTGVVVGMTDIGFDTRHVAFDGRISQVTHIDEEQGRTYTMTTPSEIYAWETDTCAETHATHVCGILAGGYTANGYHGVAPGAEIVATTSTALSNVGLLYGIEQIIARAKSEGRPAVANMSMSCHIGPHDGSDLTCRYLSRMAQDAIICISAGNSGSRNISATHIFTVTDSIASVMPNSLLTYDGFAVDGMVDVWSADDTPLTARVEMYDIQTNTILAASPWMPADSLQATFDAANVPLWAELMEGQIKVERGLSPLNGRYNLTFTLDYSTTTPSAQGPWARYYPILSLKPHRSGAAPSRPAVEIYADAVRTYLGPVDGRATSVGSQLSVNNMCTADGVVCVGACVSRNSVPTFADAPLTWNMDVNAVSRFSSWRGAGREGAAPLPHFCAPGAYLVSAYSNPYMHANEDPFTHLVTIDGRSHYFGPMAGTSMSSPFAAGVFALWLQADPTLTSREAIEIAQKTARTDFADIADPRWGAGAIDALAGLKEVLSRAGIANVCPDARTLVTVTPDRRIQVFGATSYTLYNIQGRRLDPSLPLRPGVYIVALPSQPSQKLLVR